MEVGAAWGLRALFEKQRRQGTTVRLSFCTLNQLPARSDISPASSTNDGTGDERRQATVHAKARRTERSHATTESPTATGGQPGVGIGKWTD